MMYLIRSWGERKEGDIKKILHEMLFEILQKPPKLLANSREVSAVFHAVFHAVFFGEKYCIKYCSKYCEKWKNSCWQNGPYYGQKKNERKEIWLLIWISSSRRIILLYSTYLIDIWIKNERKEIWLLIWIGESYYKGIDLWIKNERKSLDKDTSGHPLVL